MSFCLLGLGFFHAAWPDVCRSMLEVFFFNHPLLLRVVILWVFGLGRRSHYFQEVERVLGGGLDSC